MMKLSRMSKLNEMTEIWENMYKETYSTRNGGALQETRHLYYKKWGGSKLRNTLTKWRELLQQVVVAALWLWDRAPHPANVFCWKKRVLKSEVPLLDISNNKNEVVLEKKIERTRSGALKAIRKIVRKNAWILGS